MGKIIIANKEFEIDANVITFRDPPHWDATKKECVDSSQPCPDGKPFAGKKTNTGVMRYYYRPKLHSYKDNPPLEAAQALIKQFVVHHDGCRDSKMCWNVLHNERGLSCHFLIDNDGTIYQTLDLALMGFHAAIYNISSVGVELASRGDVKRDPGYYSKKGMSRNAATCKIHGHIYEAWEFTKAQKESLTLLAKGLTRMLPNLPLEYPQDSPGHQAWGEIENARSYAGYVGHFHLTRKKWDPGPFDFKEFIEKVRGGHTFPIFPAKPKKGQLKPQIPKVTEELREDTKRLYRKNEMYDGGYFPASHYNERRLWHGGVHLRTDFKGPVFAPFAGRIVAARTGLMSLYGSGDFVLLRHDMHVGQHRVRFFSLYFHLLAERDGDEQPEWKKRNADWQKARRGATVLLDEPVEAGEMIGRVGKAGPDGIAQIHFEIFSEDEVMTQISGDERSPWTVVYGGDSGRFADHPELTEMIDTDGDKKFSRRELSDFFTGGGSDVNLVRFYAVQSLSEWVGEPDWFEELRYSPDFEDLTEKQLKEMIDDQITPNLWWDDRVARHAGLPREGVVYHYHPITFVKYVNEKLLEANALAADGVGDFDADDASGPPPGVVDDFGDTDGDSFLAEEDLVNEEEVEDLSLEELVNGFEQ